MFPLPASMRALTTWGETNQPGLLEALRMKLPMLTITHTQNLNDAMFLLSSNLYQAAVIDIDCFGAVAGASMGQARRTAPKLWLLGLSARIPANEVHAVEGARWMPLIHPCSLAKALEGQWRAWRAEAGRDGL